LTLGNLANLHLQKNEDTTAEEIFAEALDIQREIFGSFHPQVARTLVNFGVCQRRLGKLPEALISCQTALDTLEALVSPNNTDLASCCNSLANIFLQLQQEDNALATYARGRKIIDNAPVFDKPTYIILLRNEAGTRFQIYNQTQDVTQIQE